MNVELHEVLVEPFKDWLRSRGLELSPPIRASDDPEDVFHIVTIPQWRWDALKLANIVRDGGRSQGMGGRLED